MAVEKADKLKSIRAAAAALNITRKTLRCWKKQKVTVFPSFFHSIVLLQLFIIT